MYYILTGDNITHTQHSFNASRLLAILLGLITIVFFCSHICM